MLRRSGLLSVAGIVGALAAAGSIVAFGSAAARPVVIYVSPSGSDSATGAARAPLRSLSAAQSRVRKLAPHMRSDILVVLRHGVYTLASTWRLTAGDSGRNGHRVIWAAAPGEQVVISGGRRITGWHPWQRGIWRAPVGALATRQLFVNGTRAIRARGDLDQLTPTATGYLRPGGLDGWHDAPAIQFVYRDRWMQHFGNVASASGDTITMAEPFWTNYGLMAQHVGASRTTPAYVENALELLDRPGEWYLDRQRHDLYYMPRAGERLATATVVAPVLTGLVEASGTLARPLRNVTFRGITFAYTTWLEPSGPGGYVDVQADFALTGRNGTFVDDSERWQKMPAAVSFRATRDVDLTGDTFIHLGASGLSFAFGSTVDSIIGSVVRDVSGNGIVLGDIVDPHPADAREPVARIAVRDDVVDSVAQEYAGGVGIWSGYVHGVSITHNVVRNLPYTGVSLGWGWGDIDVPGHPTPAGRNVVRANRVESVVQVLADGAGVYTQGAQPGTVVDANVVVGVHNYMGGLYADDGTQGVSFTDNVVWRSWKTATGERNAALFKGNGNTVRGNYWDGITDMTFQWQSDSIIDDNHVIQSLAQAPRRVILGAGLEPRYASIDHKRS
jgi:hypothetical protein